MKKTIFKNYQTKWSVAIATALLVLMMVPVNAFALTASQLQAQKDYYAAQAKAAAAAAAQKQKYATAIQAQIGNLDTNISNLQNTISKTQTQISDSQNSIADLKQKVQQEQINLATEKDKMNQVLTQWYMQGDSGLLEATIGSNSISEVIDQQQQYDSVKQRITDSIDKITILKQELDKQKNDQEAQLALLNGLKSDQTTQQSSLQRNMQNKNSLLTNTKSAITDLNNQSAQAQAEVARLTKEIQAAYQTYGGGSSGSSGPIKHRSSGGPQIDVPYYSQQDPSWAVRSLGNTGYTIGDFGCLITSFAMVGSYFGPTRNPTDIDNSSFFYDGGYFGGFGSNMGRLQGYEGRKSVNLDVIDSQLSRNNPVIVGVYLTGSFTHWIVLTGGDQEHGYSWNDPYPWRNPPNYTSFFAMRTFD